eukprot:1394926-Amorphochlora_amoeboformis.AAC.1
MAGNPAKFLGMSNRKSESYIPGTRRGFATRYSASRKKLSYTQPSASLGAEEGLESFWTPRLRRVFELRGGVLIGNATRVLREAAGRYGDNKAVELCDQILAQTRLRVVYPMAHITWGTKKTELKHLMHINFNTAHHITHSQPEVVLALGWSLELAGEGARMSRDAWYT